MFSPASVSCYMIPVMLRWMLEPSEKEAINSSVYKTCKRGSPMLSTSHQYQKSWEICAAQGAATNGFLQPKRSFDLCYQSNSESSHLPMKDENWNDAELVKFILD